METFFYVIGGVLVLLALLISALGLRSDRFPTPAMLRVGVLVVALVVGATAYGAVQLSEEEQAHRLEEENIEASEEQDLTTAENAAEDGGGPSTDIGEAEDSDVPGQDEVEAGADGATVFVEAGCGSCHSLADLGNEAVGEVGPNLDVELVDEDADFIRTSIVDPGDEIADGFSDGIMPGDYEEILDPEELDALVTYLDEAAGNKESVTQGAGSSGGAADKSGN
jgi:mono/diheme cytochrome c family protein